MKREEVDSNRNEDAYVKSNPNPQRRSGDALAREPIQLKGN
jgi:hypothetical protein